VFCKSTLYVESGVSAGLYTPFVCLVIEKLKIDCIYSEVALIRLLMGPKSVAKPKCAMKCDVGRDNGPLH